MIYITHSNRLEQLLEAFIQSLNINEINTTPDPFSPEIILVPHLGMQHWITHQIAIHTGIAANLQFPTPNVFFRQLAKFWESYGLIGHLGWHKEELVWKIMLKLPELIATDETFVTLKNYVRSNINSNKNHNKADSYNKTDSHDKANSYDKANNYDNNNNDLRLLQLAQDIATIFTQYLMLRPDWVCAWEQGEATHWQAKLWRALISTDEWHWGHLLQKLQKTTMSHNTDRDNTNHHTPFNLPSRISLFGIRNLAPLQFTLIERIALYTQVQIFHLNPMRQAWNTVKNSDGMVKHNIYAQRAMQPDPNGRLDLANPLLATLGHAGQILLSQLLELDATHTVKPIEAGLDTLLHRLQNDLLAAMDQDTKAPKDTNDPATIFPTTDISIQIHACHSPLREIQILHNRLLDLFTKHPDLTPQDILVMAVDMDIYTPYIEAIFGAAEGRQYIPWSIAKRPYGFAAQSLHTALNSLLQLPESRFTVSDILPLLRIPALQRRLKLDTTDLQNIERWIQESGIRWGIDTKHQTTLDLPEESLNTWQFGLQRLFLGMAMAPDTQAELYHGVLPYPNIEGSEVEALGALQTLFTQLTFWHQHLQSPRSLKDWRLTLDSFFQDFFALDIEEQEFLQILRSGIENLNTHASTVGFNRTISLQAFRNIVTQILDTATNGPLRLFTGQVTFCSLDVMSAIPFRVICLLGMNSSDFPRHQHSHTFNLLTDQPRRGDPSQRLDDNGLFLDTILAARDCFYISYLGHSLQDNSTKLPAIVVSELIEYINKHYRIKSSIESSIESSSNLVAEHPLQPFSHKAYNGKDLRLQSYNSKWLEAAYTETDPNPTIFAPQPLQTAPDSTLQTLNVDDLIRCIADPAQYFLTHRLGLDLFQNEISQEDIEPFYLDNLQLYKLKELVFPLVQADWEDTAILKHIRAEGLLPHGAIGELEFENILTIIQPIATRLAQYTSTPPQEPLEVNLKLGAFQLQGWLQGIRPEGLVEMRVGKLRCKDRLSLWIRHLVLCCLKPSGVNLESVYITENATLHLATVAVPQPILEDLLALRWQGLMEPLTFFPETAWAWYEKTHNNDYLNVWNGNMHCSGDSENTAVQIAFRGRNPVKEDAFFTIASRILGPLKVYSQVTEL